MLIFSLKILFFLCIFVCIIEGVEMKSKNVTEETQNVKSKDVFESLKIKEKLKKAHELSNNLNIKIVKKLKVLKKLEKTWTQLTNQIRKGRQMLKFYRPIVNKIYINFSKDKKNRNKIMKSDASDVDRDRKKNFDNEPKISNHKNQDLMSNFFEIPNSKNDTIHKKNKKIKPIIKEVRNIRKNGASESDSFRIVTPSIEEPHQVQIGKVNDKSTDFGVIKIFSNKIHRSPKKMKIDNKKMSLSSLKSKDKPENYVRSKHDKKAALNLMQQQNNEDEENVENGIIQNSRSFIVTKSTQNMMENDKIKDINENDINIQLKNPSSIKKFKKRKNSNVSNFDSDKSNLSHSKLIFDKSKNAKGINQSKFPSEISNVLRKVNDGDIRVQPIKYAPGANDFDTISDDDLKSQFVANLVQRIFKNEDLNNMQPTNFSNNKMSDFKIPKNEKNVDTLKKYNIRGEVKHSSGSKIGEYAIKNFIDTNFKENTIGEKYLKNNKEPSQDNIKHKIIVPADMKNIRIEKNLFIPKSSNAKLKHLHEKSKEIFEKFPTKAYKTSNELANDDKAIVFQKPVLSDQLNHRSFSNTEKQAEWLPNINVNTFKTHEENFDKSKSQTYENLRPKNLNLAGSNGTVFLIDYNKLVRPYKVNFRKSSATNSRNNLSKKPEDQNYNVAVTSTENNVNNFKYSDLIMQLITLAKEGRAKELEIFLRNYPEFVDALSKFTFKVPDSKTKSIGVENRTTINNNANIIPTSSAKEDSIIGADEGVFSRIGNQKMLKQNDPLNKEKVKNKSSIIPEMMTNSKTVIVNETSNKNDSIPKVNESQIESYNISNDSRNEIGILKKPMNDSKQINEHFIEQTKTANDTDIKLSENLDGGANTTKILKNNQSNSDLRTFTNLTTEPSNISLNISKTDQNATNTQNGLPEQLDLGNSNAPHSISNKEDIDKIVGMNPPKYDNKSINGLSNSKENETNSVSKDKIIDNSNGNVKNLVF